MNDELENNGIETLTSIAKGLFGIVPIFGPMFAELIQNIIPNQRIDRITSFLILLDDRFKALNKDFIELKMKNELYVDLFEDCCRAVSRALTDERKEYIANLFVNGIKDEDRNIINHKKLLFFLNQMDDIDLIMLKYLSLKEYNSDKLKEFYQSHLNILTIERDNELSTNDNQNSIESLRIHIRHLMNIGLIKNDVVDLGTFGEDGIEGKDNLEELSVYWYGIMLLKEINELPEDFPVK